MTFVQYVLRRNFCIEVLHKKEVEALKALKFGGVTQSTCLAHTYLESNSTADFSSVINTRRIKERESKIKNPPTLKK